MEAFGHPGLEPRWATGRKHGVGTAISAASRVWFTLARGIVTEVYYPRVDQANVRDLQFLVSDGRTFFHEEQRDMQHEIRMISARALAYEITSRSPQGHYQIRKRIVTHPERNALVLKVWWDFERDGLDLYVLLAPHVNNQGWGNYGRVEEIGGRKALLAWRERTACALVSSVPMPRASCGFVGFSDGWQDLQDSFQMDWEFDSASDGNVALTAKLQAVPGEPFTMVLAFSEDPDVAAEQGFQVLAEPFEDVESAYIHGWEDYCSTLMDLSGESQDGGRLFWTSAMVIRAHEDKTHPGAVIASLSIPWGDSATAFSRGGYHLVWPRDLYHAAAAALAAGDRDLPVRCLRYLISTQQDDGAWPQNFWVDGTPYWLGLQLDEVAFPIILARLLVARELLDEDPHSMVKQAGFFIARNGPVTPQERWEENAGYSPSTLAAEIAALVCASAFARDHQEHDVAGYFQAVADYWAAKLEDWTFTQCGNIVPGHPRHYERIASMPVEDVAHGAECRVFLPIRNLPAEISDQSQCCIIDGGFLELVRLGIRAWNHPAIVETMVAYDFALRVETPDGPGWRRYNHDGYGEKADGSAFDGAGIGRLWPLVTGERGHYELTAARSVDSYVKTMESFANEGCMIAEQVWDRESIPEKELMAGKGTGSATPLVWAHAEYLRLLRSRRDRQSFGLLDEVYQRYASKPAKFDIAIWKPNHRLRAIRAADRLRIEVYEPAYLHWSRDNWVTVEHEPMSSLEHRVFSREFPAGFFSPGRPLQFTFLWSDTGRWEGNDYCVAIV